MNDYMKNVMKKVRRSIYFTLFLFVLSVCLGIVAYFIK